MEFQKDIPLSKYSNYKIGGAARYFYVPKTAEEVLKGIEKAKKEGLPIFVLGGATNLLISDKGFSGLVIKPDIKVLEESGGKIRVGAGVNVADLLQFVIQHSLAGLEWAGGLPGTVGGAIRGNAGAFGGEIKDVVEEVTSLDLSGNAPKIVKHDFKASKFGYRSSIFKEKGGAEIILEATLALKKGDQQAIRDAIQTKINYRLERHPMDLPNIGSIFKNVDWKDVPKEVQERFIDKVKKDPFPVLPTAILLSEAGLKGVREGGAMFSPKHPNFIVNVESASAADVKKLIALAKETIKQKFGVILEEEVQWVE